MAYLKPPAFTAKVFNRLAMKTGMAGTHTLSVAGRTSGLPRPVPVLPIEHEGVRYLVSTRGESEWVLNVRAAGVVDLVRKGTPERLRAVEIAAPERPAVLQTYQRIGGRTVAGYFRKLPDPADHPVFRLEPAAS